MKNQIQQNSRTTSTTPLRITVVQCFAFIGLVASLLLGAASSWAANGNAYIPTNLVSDIPGIAENTDPNLVNPWGLTISSSNTFWVSDNGTGLSTLYDLNGVPQSLVVTIPPSASNNDGANPTGQVFNTGPGFVVTQNGHSGAALFIFVAEDGSISGWNPSVAATQAVLAIDHGSQGTVYKGAALASVTGGQRLYATDFHNGKVEIYDQNFTEIDNGQTFVDPTIPQGYAPFGIQNINGLIYVTYAKQDADRHDDVPGPGHGFVSVFNTDGSFVTRLISRGRLNSPWGLALAPQGFGIASGSLLVGNFGDGMINAVDINSGAGLGSLKRGTGAPIVIDGLWALLFVNTDLYVTAGFGGESHGLLAKIQARNP